MKHKRGEKVQHRDGNPRNELAIGDAVPLRGGPLNGQVVHQPNEVTVVDYRLPDGRSVRYERAGGFDDPHYVFVE